MEKKKIVKKVNVRTFDQKTNAVFNVLIAFFCHLLYHSFYLCDDYFLHR